VSQRALNDEQFGPYFHGTSAQLKEGDVLRGPGQGGRMTFDPPNESYSPGHVYYTTSPSQAESFAHAAARRHGGTPTVYEVHPGEGHEKDPETAGVKGWDVNYRSPTARVLREVGIRE
jgi:Rifampin ADP-ribosyl transferase